MFVSSSPTKCCFLRFPYDAALAHAHDLCSLIHKPEMQGLLWTVSSVQIDNVNWEY